MKIYELVIAVISRLLQQPEGNVMELVHII